MRFAILLCRAHAVLTAVLSIFSEIRASCSYTLALRCAERDALNATRPVLWVSRESGSYRGLIQASAVRFPSIRLEVGDRPRWCVLWWSSHPCAMRAMMVKIGFEVEQLAFEIGGCPKQRTIQALSAEGADQPLHKWMGQRNVGHGLDFGHIQDSQVGLPLMKTIKRIVVGTEVFRD